MPDVASLLAGSRAAHADYRRASDLKNRAGARAHLAHAARLRHEADLFDPEHEDPAWHAEPPNFNHVELVAFYAKQLAH